MNDFQEPVFTEAETNARVADEVKEERKQVTASLIPIGVDGKVAARDNVELMRYCGALLNGLGVPKRFDTPQKLFAALMFARDLKLPDTAIRQIANIQGTMTIFGDLPLALAQRTEEMTHFKEQWFDDKYKTICFENQNLDAKAWGSVCFVKRGTGEVQSFSFTIDDAKAAGLYPPMKNIWENRQKVGQTPDPDSPWEKYTKLMLRYKARAIALKSLFADAINGVAIAEYDFDVLPSAEGDNFRDVTPEDHKNQIKNKIASVLGENNGQT